MVKHQQAGLVETAFCSFRGPSLFPTIILGGLQSPVIPILEDTMPSPGLFGYLHSHMPHIYLEFKK